MADSSANNQSVTDTDEFRQWLAATLGGFPPAPGPAVAKRLIDVLDPRDRPLETHDLDAA